MSFVRNDLGVCFDDAHKSFNGFGNGGQSNIDHIAIHDFYKAKSFETDITNYGVQFFGKKVGHRAQSPGFLFIALAK